MKAHLFGIMVAAAMFSAPAQAQKLYVNGVDVTGVVNLRLDGATVVIDAHGDIRIEAPGYHVQVLPQGGSGSTGSSGGTTTTTTTTTGVSGGSSGGGQTIVYSDSGQAMTTGPATYNPPIVEQTTTTVVTTTAGSSGGSSGSGGGSTSGGSASTGGGTASTAGSTSVGTATPRPAGTPAPTKQYFLITQGTGGAAVGETVQINVNGQHVRTVDSSTAQVIDDITEFMNLGDNAVTMMSTKKPTFAAGSASSTFQVILGEGHVEHGGQVVIDNPLVTYTRTAADATANSRSYTLHAR
ncbi:MAG: hypothetical protein HY905_18505 [Deltaproteobacteria bacterium]|nr:hypothetical protein [Deltaproteobacteria bacterium]